MLDNFKTSGVFLYVLCSCSSVFEERGSSRKRTLAARMDLLPISPVSLTFLTCLVLNLPLLRSASVPQAERRHEIISLKRFPGGTSQGGSSATREELLDKIARIFQSKLTFSGNYREGQGFRKEKRPRKDPVTPPRCLLENPDDIQRLLPGRFLSEDDLMHTLPHRKSLAPSGRDRTFTPQRRVVTTSIGASGASEGSGFQQQGFNVKTEFMGAASICEPCMTEIGYEIVDHVTDFTGRNHTVINFKNAYQFIPAGRCLNENSPCGGGVSRCRQVMRAHWSLVWTEGTGVNLVAHEVPSHCECVNIGITSFAAPSSAQTADSMYGGGGAAATLHTKTEEIGIGGPAGGELKMAGLKVDQQEKRQGRADKTDPFSLSSFVTYAGSPSLGAEPTSSPADSQATALVGDDSATTATTATTFLLSSSSLSSPSSSSHSSSSFPPSSSSISSPSFLSSSSYASPVIPLTLASSADVTENF